MKLKQAVVVEEHKASVGSQEENENEGESFEGEVSDIDSCSLDPQEVEICLSHLKGTLREVANKVRLQTPLSPKVVHPVALVV